MTRPAGIKRQCPWTAALAVGLLAIHDGRAVPGPTLPGWASTADDAVLDGWSRALAAASPTRTPTTGTERAHWRSPRWH